MSGLRRYNQDVIRRELAGIVLRGSLATFTAPAGWMLTRDVARAWRVSGHTVHGLTTAGVVATITRKPARGTRSLRGSGALWNAAEVLRVDEIRRRCRISLPNALRVFAAIKQGGVL